MKKLTCQSLGQEDCPFMAKGDTAEEVVQTMMAHGKRTHAADFEGKSDEEMEKVMMEKVAEA